MQQEAIEVGKWFQQKYDKTFHGGLLFLTATEAMSRYNIEKVGIFYFELHRPPPNSSL